MIEHSNFKHVDESVDTEIDESERGRELYELVEDERDRELMSEIDKRGCCFCFT